MVAESRYFTWPDGALSYDCVGCAECCKGLGIGLDAAGGQVARLVEAYPELTAFLRKRGSTWTAFNPRGRCWFLDPEGLCRIEREHGRAVKPASCRLFPFNRVFRLGGTLIVDYNSVICPLRASDHGSDKNTMRQPPCCRFNPCPADLGCINSSSICPAFQRSIACGSSIVAACG